MARETKSQLKQRTEELKRLYAESERQLIQARNTLLQIAPHKAQQDEGCLLFQWTARR